MRVCSVYGCDGTNKTLCRMPSFKRNNEQFIKWVTALRNPRYANYTEKQIYHSAVVCSKHFEESPFCPLSRKIKQGVVPTKNLYTGPTEPWEIEKQQERECIDLPETEDLQLVEGHELLSNFHDYQASQMEFSEGRFLFNHLPPPDVKAVSRNKEPIILPDIRRNYLKPNNSCNKVANTKPIENVNPSSGSGSTKPCITYTKTTEKLIIEDADLTPKSTFKFSKLHDTEHNQNEICRFCLTPADANEMTILKDGEIKTSELNPLLEILFPELDLNLTSTVAICSKCMEMIRLTQDFRTTVSATENRLNEVLKRSQIFANQDKQLIITELGSDQVLNQNEVVISQIRELKESIASKRRPQNFLCEGCGKTLTSRRGLRYHAKKHKLELKGKPPKFTTKLCELCGEVLKNVSDYNNHLLRHFPRSCKVCNRKFFTKTSFAFHNREYHNKNKEISQCHICGKIFKLKSSLRLHIPLHTSTKDNKCDKCSAAFTTKQGLMKHRKKHFIAQVLKCPYCEKVLKYEVSLRRHIEMMHYHESNIKCEICDKPYWKDHDLKKHMRKVHQIESVRKPNRRRVDI